MKNLLLVSFDCARADVAYRGILPNLDRLRKCGVTFTHAVSSAPITPVSHATVFTGLQPYHHGLRHLLRTPLSPGQTLLAAHLQQHGFRTGATVSCMALNRWYGMARGFDVYDDAVAPYRDVALKRADYAAEMASRWISGCEPNQRWFCFLHFFDAHFPYIGEQEIGDAANAYEAGLKYADDHLGHVLELLERLGQLDDTLIVVFGDHGEDLKGIYPNDKGGAKLGHPEEHGHGCLLYETTQHVPLVFSHPGFEPCECDTLVGLVDIAVTICSLFGLPRLGYTDGIDLSSLIRNESPPVRQSLYAETLFPTVVAEKRPDFGPLPNLQAMWFGSAMKAIRSWEDDRSLQVYNLAEDPYEQRPVAFSNDIGPIRWPRHLPRKLGGVDRVSSRRKSPT